MQKQLTLKVILMRRTIIVLLLKILKKTLCMLTGLVMESIGPNTITLELQALKKNHSVLFILEMRKMK